MANGSTIIEDVKALLAEEKAISTKTALRLMLGSQLELHKAVKDAETQMQKMSGRVEILERKSIMLWISNHPKLALVIVSIFVVLTTVVDLRVVLAKALHIDL